MKEKLQALQNRIRRGEETDPMRAVAALVSILEDAELERKPKRSLLARAQEILTPAAPDA